MPVELSNLLTGFGLLGATTLAACGLAYALFRYLGDKWLSSRFSERLEGFKHAQQREIEELRLRINTTLDRAVKLHQFEFEALPEIWTKLNDAYGSATALVAALQSHPDLDRMSAPHLNSFLDEADLADWEKEELRAGGDKTRRYIKKAFWHRFNKSWGVWQTFNNYFIIKSIFLDEPLKGKISELNQMIVDALFERRIEEEMDAPREGRFEKSRALGKEGQPKMEAIGAEIRARLNSVASLE